jgi:hypothetical protein
VEWSFLFLLLIKDSETLPILFLAVNEGVLVQKTLRKQCLVFVTPGSLTKCHDLELKVNFLIYYFKRMEVSK